MTTFNPFRKRPKDPLEDLARDFALQDERLMPKEERVAVEPRLPFLEELRQFPSVSGRATQPLAFEEAVELPSPTAPPEEERRIPVLTGLEQLFTMAGAAITAPFRVQDAPFIGTEKDLLTRVGEFLSIYPGGRGYEIYKQWRATKQPTMPVGIPSWQQWGAWLKPLLKNDLVLRSLGVDPSQWEEPQRYQMARIGMAETGEIAPLFFLPMARGVKTTLDKALDISLKQTSKGKPMEEAMNIAFEQLGKKGQLPKFVPREVPEAPPIKPQVPTKVIPERVMPIEVQREQIIRAQSELDLLPPEVVKPQSIISARSGLIGTDAEGKVALSIQVSLDEAGVLRASNVVARENVPKITIGRLLKQAEPQLREAGIQAPEAGLSPEGAKLAAKLAPKAPPVKPPVTPEPEVLPTAGDMPAIEELLVANYDLNIAARLGEKLVKAPGIMGSINKSLLPMQAAKTPAERGGIAWMALKDDIAPSLARIEMDIVYTKDFPFKFAAPLYKKGTLPIKPIEEGLVRGVKPKLPAHKPFIQAIAEFPDRYILTPAQRAELDLLDGILQKQLAKEIKAGVNVRPVGLKVGQRYMPRFVREILDLETKAITEVRRGVSTRPGVRPSSFRTRYYEEVLDGMVKGKKYTTDLRAAVEMRVTAGNKAIADKQFADFLKPLGKLPKERISPSLRKARENVVDKRLALRNISSLIEQINAEARIDWPYWLGIKRWYPEQYAELRAIAKTGKQVPQKLKSWIVNEKTTLRTTSREITPRYKVALARARAPILGKEGIINHAGLQGEIFPIEVSSPVNELIRKEITTHQVLNQIAKVNDVARMGQTAIDMGPALIQGQLVLFNNPKAWGKMWEISLKTLWNPKYRARYGLTNKATETLMAKHGAAPFGASEFTLAARPGGWLSQIPYLGKAFERFGKFFEALIDTGRIEQVKAHLPHYTRKAGRKLTSRELTDLVVSIDHMVGISSMTRLGMSGFIRTLSRNVLYAPRYYLAFVSFLGRAFQGGIGGDIARKGLTRWLFGSAVFMSALAVALQQKERIIPTKERPIPKMFDPRSGEMYTVEIGGVHVGLGGVYVAGLRLLGSLVRTVEDDPVDFLSIDPHEQPFLRYGYGRSSPIASAAIDVATGKNYLGERLDSPDDYLKEVIDKTFPFWLAGQITDVPEAGWGKGMAEWWGLRAWMVQYRELARVYAEEHIKDIPQEIIMPWQREKITGGNPLTYDDLNNEQRGWLLLTFQDYREVQEKVKEDVFRRGTDYQVMDTYIREELDAVYNFELVELANGVLAGANTIQDYQDGAEYQRRIRQGQYQRRALEERYMDDERVKSLEKWLEENIKSEDMAYDKYMELRGNPPKAFGKPDWDAWEKNIDTYLDSLDAETKAYIERKRDDWINNLPPEVQQVERLILESEAVLDVYYSVPQGKDRLVFRDANPEVDAKLALLGRVSVFRTNEGAQFAASLLEKYGVPGLAIPAFIKITEEGKVGGGTTWQNPFR